MAAARDVDIVSGVVRCVCVPGRRRRDILFDGHVNRSFLVEAITICKFVSEQITVDGVFVLHDLSVVSLRIYLIHIVQA